MTQYINKSALVAEINKRIMDAPINYIGHQRVWAYNDVKDILNTLEAKEIDLEDAKDMARRDIAWNVHVMVSEGKSVAEIDHYVCSVCDF